MREQDRERPEASSLSPVGDGQSETSSPLSRSQWLRALLLFAGSLSLALAVLGIFLPLLPTTPLVLRHRVFGPIVRDWHEHRSVPPKAKWTGIALVLIAFAVGIQFLPSNVYIYVAHLAIGAALVVFLASLPSTPRTEEAGS